MTGRRRSAAQIARDRQREADLYLQGWLQVDIAEELGIDQSTVSRDLKAIHQDWLASALRDFDEAKARELAKIDHLEREYWQAWERSCEDAETIRQEGSRTGDGGDELPPVSKIVKTRKGQAGDPRFLTGVQWCVERRCKILGIDAPDKREISGPGGEPLIPIPELTDAERASALAGFVERLSAEADRCDDSGPDQSE